MRRLFDGVLFVMAMASIVLWGSSYIHGGSVAGAAQSPTKEQLERVVLGALLPPLQRVSRAPGEVESFDPAGSLSLLLLVNPTCSACARSVPSWTTLLDSMPTGIRAIALSQGTLADLTAWTATTRLPVETLVADASLAEWGVIGTPMTLLVGDSGRVAMAWAGRFDAGEIPSFVQAARRLQSTNHKDRRRE